MPNPKLVVTVTPNPMLDKTLAIPALRRGEITRATALELRAGGKGINVARQLHRLGAPTLALGFLGGPTGAVVQALVEAENIPHEFITIAGTTREGFVLREVDGTATSVFEPAPEVTPAETDRLIRQAGRLAEPGGWLVGSGTIPSPALNHLYAELIESANQCRVNTFLDATGEPLRRGLAARPMLVKPNREEFETTFSSRLESEADLIAALKQLQGAGARYAVLTDGGAPFHAASPENVYRVTPPKIRAINPIGSGDAMVAGLIHGFREGWPFDRTLAYATAVGAATALKWAIADALPEEIAALLEDVRVETLI